MSNLNPQLWVELCWVELGFGFGNYSASTFPISGSRLERSQAGASNLETWGELSTSLLFNLNAEFFICSQIFWIQFTQFIQCYWDHFNGIYIHLKSATVQKTFNHIVAVLVFLKRNIGGKTSPPFARVAAMSAMQQQNGKIKLHWTFLYFPETQLRHSLIKVGGRNHPPLSENHDFSTTKHPVDPSVVVQ